jgi:anti-anti-sigma factor
VDSHGVTVDVARDGPVCVLSAGGELDVLAAGDFLARAARAVNHTARTGAGQAERLVLDLSGLSFLDCSGVRALAWLTQAVPDECPVVVRSLSQAARRVLDLVGLNLEHRPAAPPPGTGDGITELVRRSQAVRSAAREVMGQVADLAEAVSATEDMVAATMARMAGQRPHRAARLTVLSDQARSHAAANRRRAGESSLRLREPRAGQAAGAG